MAGDPVRDAGSGRSNVNRTTIRVALATVVSCAWFWGACDSAGDHLADAMVDAADTMGDAAATLRDGGDASAQTPGLVYEGPCNLERTQRIENDASGVATERTEWYVELRDSSIEPESVVAVRTLACDEEYLGSSVDPSTCPDGSTCTGDLHSRLRCRVGAGAEIESGIVRVSCGWRQRIFSGDGSLSSDFGQRSGYVHVSIE